MELPSFSLAGHLDKASQHICLAFKWMMAGSIALIIICLTVTGILAFLHFQTQHGTVATSHQPTIDVDDNRSHSIVALGNNKIVEVKTTYKKNQSLHSIHDSLKASLGLTTLLPATHRVTTTTNTNPATADTPHIARPDEVAVNLGGLPLGGVKGVVVRGTRLQDLITRKTVTISSGHQIISHNTSLVAIGNQQYSEVAETGPTE